jgi:hypothetical protein
MAGGNAPSTSKPEGHPTPTSRGKFDLVRLHPVLSDSLLAGLGKHFQGRTREIQGRSQGGAQPGVASGCGSGSVSNQGGWLLVVG